MATDWFRADSASDIRPCIDLFPWLYPFFLAQVILIVSLSIYLIERHFDDPDPEVGEVLSNYVTALKRSSLGRRRRAPRR